MAAIQIAHHLGAEVIASAGSPAKRALLESLGVKHVIDSRRGDFAEAVMETYRRQRRRCGPERARRGSHPDGPLLPRAVRPLHRDRQARHLSELPHSRSGRCARTRRSTSSPWTRSSAATRSKPAELLEKIAGLGGAASALHPLPFRSFPACRIDAAFRLMAQGKHTGKVIVSFPEPFVPRRGEPLAPAFRSEAGRLLSHHRRVWRLRQGAGRMAGGLRRAASRAHRPQRRLHPGSAGFVAKLRGSRRGRAGRQGRRRSPRTSTALLADIASAGHPLKGVFHLAMVIDDAPHRLAHPRAHAQGASRPKAHGAWLLHEGTRGLELDCFVMFSSVSSVFGNPGAGQLRAPPMPSSIPSRIIARRSACPR